MECYGMEWHGMAGNDMEWHGMVWKGMEWHAHDCRRVHAYLRIYKHTAHMHQCSCRAIHCGTLRFWHLLTSYSDPHANISHMHKCTCSMHTLSCPHTIAPSDMHITQYVSLSIPTKLPLRSPTGLFYFIFPRFPTLMRPECGELGWGTKEILRYLNLRSPELLEELREIGNLTCFLDHDARRLFTIWVVQSSAPIYNPRSTVIYLI